MALTQIKGSNIEDGTVVAADVADNAVTGAKIAMGSDAAGDILTYNGTDYIRLAKGTAEQVLKMNSGATAVEWGTDAGGIAIPGSSVAGDTLYHNGTIYTRLAKGTASQVLTMNAGATAPEWAAAGGGDPSYVQFPAVQVASSDVNRLDDYEEGTWTAALNCGGGSASFYAANNTGGYIKIGRQVMLHGFFYVQSISSPSSYLQLTGLPFAVGANTEDSDSTVLPVYLNSTMNNQPIPGGIVAYTWSGNSYAKFVKAGATSSNDIAQYLAVNTYMSVGGGYYASA
jgi:hypothetical protein